MKKRPVAIIIMAVLLVIAVPLGAYTSLSPMRDKAADEIYYDEAGFSIYEAVNSRADAAENINKIAEKYSAGDSSFNTLIDDLDRAVSHVRITWAEDVSELAQANSELDLPANELVNKMKASSAVSTADVSTVDGQITEMESQQYKIDRGSYNGAATEYNSRLRQFPVSLLSRLGLLEQMELFE